MFNNSPKTLTAWVEHTVTHSIFSRCGTVWVISAPVCIKFVRRKNIYFKWGGQKPPKFVLSSKEDKFYERKIYENYLSFSINKNEITFWTTKYNVKPRLWASLCWGEIKYLLYSQFIGNYVNIKNTTKEAFKKLSKFIIWDHLQLEHIRRRRAPSECLECMWNLYVIDWRTMDFF